MANFVYTFDKDNTADKGAKINPTTGHPYNYDYFKEPLKIVGRFTGNLTVYNNFDEYVAKGNFTKDRKMSPLWFIARQWIRIKLDNEGVNALRANLDKEIAYFFETHPQYKDKTPYSTTYDSYCDATLLSKEDSPFFQETAEYMEENDLRAENKIEKSFLCKDLDEEERSKLLAKLMKDRLHLKRREAFKPDTIIEKSAWYELTGWKEAPLLYNNKRRVWDEMKKNGEIPLCVLDWIEHPEKGLTYEDIKPQVKFDPAREIKKSYNDKELRNELNEMYEEPTEEEKQKWQEKFGSNK